MEPSSMFQWQDYLVLAVVLGLSAAIGFFYACTGGKQKTTKEYLQADNSMHWLPVSASLVSSFISSQTLIGHPGEVYSHGTMFGYVTLAIPVAIFTSVTLYLPVLKRLKITSVNEYIDMRFGRTLKLAAVVLSLINSLIYTALVIYGPAMAFSAVTGLNIWISVASISVIGILYTTVGGLKAVLWADTLQFFIMIGGFLATLIIGVLNLGGFSNVWEANRISGRLDFIDTKKVFDFDPRMRHTFWTQLFGGLFLWINLTGPAQASLQRSQALKKDKDLYLSYFLATLGLMAFSGTATLVGMVLFAHYKYCDPLSQGRITSIDQLYPLFVMSTFGKYPGLPGLVLSAIFSASLSTISTTLSSCAAVILQDFVRPAVKNLPDGRAAIISKVICAVLGPATIILVVGARYVGGGVMSLGIGLTAIMSGPYIAVFTLGMLVPIANGRGTLTGFLIATLIVGWKGFGNILSAPYAFKYPTTTDACNITGTSYSNYSIPVYDPAEWNPHNHYRTGVESFYDISYAWNGLYGFLITILISIIFSLVFGYKKESSIPKKLLCKYVVGSCCLPKAYELRIDLSDGDESSEKKGYDNEGASNREEDEKL